uniref:G-protein coupled receptors family 1 profile domain-containing protein n=1 Tax=Anas platyrhynchos TaxID=8839 RepID=A0A8B9QUC2_ANAPL
MGTFAQRNFLTPQNSMGNETKKYLWFLKLLGWVDGNISSLRALSAHPSLTSQPRPPVSSRLCHRRYTKMKTATNIYIFNLALADALATSTLPFQSAKYLMETWPFGELLCKVVIFTLTMMSVDRYVAVCHPVKALDFRTPAKAKIINVCIWVLSSVIGAHHGHGDSVGMARGALQERVPGTCCIPWHPKGWWHSSWGIPAMSWHVGTHLLCVFTKDGDAHSS